MTNRKPTVFNYREYEQALLDVERLTRENQELRDRLIDARRLIRVLDIKLKVLEVEANGAEGCDQE